MISQTAQYALRAVMYLAADPDTPQTARQIARATFVPYSYLSKVLQSLSRAGLVCSQRGLHGGFTLGRAPVALSVYEIIQAVDPMERIVACPLNLSERRDGLCPLHRRLDEAISLVATSFRNTTVADLLGEEPVRKPLCGRARTLPAGS